MNFVEEGTPDTILYELICSAEWTEEKEECIPIMNLPIRKTRSGWSYLNPYELCKTQTFGPSDTALILKSLGPYWQFSCSKDGKTVAVLQDTVLETRSAKERFAPLLGSTSVIRDPFPNYRTMAWSADSTLLAVAFTNGVIVFYDVMASQLFSVKRSILPSQEGIPHDTFSMSNSLAGLFFVEERMKRKTTLKEIVSVDTQGKIKCFRQTTPDQMTYHHGASTKDYYPHGVTSAVYVESHAIILISGILVLGPTSQQQEGSTTYGITAWRLINDNPFYKIVFNGSHVEYRLNNMSWWKSSLVSLLLGKRDASRDLIFKIVPSPNNKFVAALHVSGAISIWYLPSLKLHCFWPLKSQFQHTSENPQFNNRWRIAISNARGLTIDNWRFLPFDVNWWNEESVMISRVNGGVSMYSISEAVPERNLLGDFPELFESPVFLSRKFEKGFFTLECELRLQMPSPRRGSDVSSNAEFLQSSEGNFQIMELEHHFWPKTLTMEVLFWLTDVETFRPPRKRKKKQMQWREVHRLFQVVKITSMELFLRKIEVEEYGEALDLARTYKLDADLVYQRQWSRHPVTVTTIKDYLSKIKKRNWVLQECQERVPDSIEAARQLLEFGLKGTELSVAVMISQGNDGGKFVMWSPDDLDITTDEYLSLLDPDHPEVKRLLQYRKVFLRYLRLLHTYEEILTEKGDPEQLYQASVFALLRNRSALESAVQMAQEFEIVNLEIFLKYHFDEIGSQYFLVLSSFPEPIVPEEYKEFLPAINEETGDLVMWNDTFIRELDWCEEVLRPVSVEFDVRNVCEQDVVEWFVARAKEIDSLCCMTSNSVELIRIGLQRKIKGLQNILEDFQIVEALVYDTKVGEIAIQEVEEMDSAQRLSKLMSRSTEDTFVSDFRNLANPFLTKCEENNPGSRFRLLEDFFADVTQDGLSKITKIFEESKPGLTVPLLSVEESMPIAYNCVYASKNTQENYLIYSIMNCLPERKFKVDDELLQKYYDQVEQMRMHVNTVKILEKYSLFFTPTQIKDLKNENTTEEQFTLFFKQLGQCACKINKNQADWKILLLDMLELQRLLFPNFSSEDCFKIYIYSILRSGSKEFVMLAREFFEQEPSTGTNPNRTISKYSSSYDLYIYQIPYDEALEMILDAALLSFDSASNYSDPDMDLCRTCLHLIRCSKEISVIKLFDLMDAVKILNKDFNMTILPQAVRHSRDKRAILKNAMENVPCGYRKSKHLQRLAVVLQIDDLTLTESDCLILDMVGEAAMLERDIKFCLQICQSILAKGYHAGWKVLVYVAETEKELPTTELDQEGRLAFINYALRFCPPEELLNVLNSKYLVEIRSLESRILEMTASQENSWNDDNSVTEVEEEKQEIPKVEPRKLQLPGFIGSTANKFINPLNDVAKVFTGGIEKILKESDLGEALSSYKEPVQLGIESCKFEESVDDLRCRMDALIELKEENEASDITMELEFED